MDEGSEAGDFTCGQRYLVYVSVIAPHNDLLIKFLDTRPLISCQLRKVHGWIVNLALKFI